MEDKNIYKTMGEREAMADCEKKVFWLVSDLMDAHGNWAGKDVLERILDELNDNGYFI